MYFHHHYGSPYDWVVDEKYNTKQQWRLTYEPNFIVAEANNQLINEWYETLISFIANPYTITAEKLVECGVSQFKSTSVSNQYYVVMDSIKCVIGRRQNLIEKS
jgi:hypothetical protein